MSFEVLGDLEYQQANCGKFREIDNLITKKIIVKNS